MSYQSSYDYECELSFNLNGKPSNILKECIKYIVVQYDYKNRIMPLIFINVALSAQLYNIMVPNQGIGKMYLKLYNYSQKNTSSVQKTCIYDEFDYYMSDDPNSYKKLDTTAKQGSNVPYRVCTIGLIKSELTKLNQKIFEGVYKDTNTMSLIQSATSHMKMIIEPFENNMNVETLNCPTIGSVGQFISYINSHYNFYNGSYIYFMDFAKTYLRSNNGKYIDAKDGEFPYVAFDIRDMTEYQSKLPGMVVDDKQKAYIIYVDGNDAHINMDRAIPQMQNSVLSVNTTGDTKLNVVDTSAITNVKPNEDSANIVKSDDPNASKALSSMIESEAGALYIRKVDMDNSIFTPSKQYLLANYEDNPKYCGVYYMISKNELYFRTGNNLKSQIILGLGKVSDFSKQ